MSNRRKLKTVAVAPSEASVSLARASLKMQAIAKGADSYTFNRRMKRSMRARIPLGSQLVDHSIDHERGENCGKACAPFIYKRISTKP